MAKQKAAAAVDTAQGAAVYVRINGRLGHVLGPSLNPLHYQADEAVVSVKMDDDGTVLDSGVSALGDVSELAEPEEAEAAEEAPAADESAPEAAPEAAEEAPAPAAEQP